MPSTKAILVTAAIAVATLILVNKVEPLRKFVYGA